MNPIQASVLGACMALAALHPASAAGRGTAPAAVVEGVQMPAWVELGDGRRVPLAPGMRLGGGEQIRTGTNSKILLKMAEGSRVKLGANAFLRIEELKASEGGVFKASLKLLEGAFRFTTAALAKHRRREVNIAVATVTAGIRGTDLWGKSAPDRQIVCLIEGRIELRPEGEGTIPMSDPLSFYVREHGKSQPVARVGPQQLAQWALETEIEADKGAARLGGRWKLTLASSETPEAALAVYDQLRAGGYAAEIQPAKAGEKRVYNVRIRNLPSRAEAEALAGQLRGRMGVAEPKISG